MEKFLRQSRSTVRYKRIAMALLITQLLWLCEFALFAMPRTAFVRASKTFSATIVIVFPCRLLAETWGSSQNVCNHIISFISTVAYNVRTRILP